jgi:hypothetical protein
VILSFLLGLTVVTIYPRERTNRARLHLRTPGKGILPIARNKGPQIDFVARILFLFEVGKKLGSFFARCCTTFTNVIKAL